MQTKFYFKHLEGIQKKFLEEYIEKKLPQIEKFLKRVPDEFERLEVKAEKFATKEAYIVEFVFYTPKKKFLAKEDDHTLQEAVDFAMEKLISQIRKEFSS